MSHPKGVYINGRLAITSGCNALLRTLDPCLLKNGKPYVFDNWATSNEVSTTTAVFIEGQAVLNKESTLSTTHGSEIAKSGIYSGTLKGPCHFTTCSSNVFINGAGVLRDGDLGTANNRNTKAASIIHPLRYRASAHHAFEFEVSPHPEIIDTTYKLPIEVKLIDGRPYGGRGLLFSLIETKRCVSAALDDDGKGYLYLTKQEKAQDTLFIEGWEMIDLQSGYPCHEQKIKLSAYPKTLQLFLIPKPVLINAQTEIPDEYTRGDKPLTQEEIDLLKFNGNRACVFIPRADIPYGQFARHLDDQESNNTKDSNNPSGNTRQKKPLDCLTFSEKLRTLCFDLTSVKELAHKAPEFATAFPEYQEACAFDRDKTAIAVLNTLLNGKGSIRDRTLVEYNLNKAAGFVAPDYRKYNRIISFHWCVEVGYNEVDNQSFEATTQLLALLTQLHHEQIDIDVIAHGSGAKIILQALTKIVKTSFKLDSMVLWHAGLHIEYDAAPWNSIYATAFEHINRCILIHSEKDTYLTQVYPYTLGLYFHSKTNSVEFILAEWQFKWHRQFQARLIEHWTQSLDKVSQADLYNLVGQCLRTLLKLCGNQLFIAPDTRDAAAYHQWQIESKQVLQSSLGNLLKDLKFEHLIKDIFQAYEQTLEPFWARFHALGLRGLSPQAYSKKAQGQTFSITQINSHSGHEEFLVPDDNLRGIFRAVVKSTQGFGGFGRY